MSVRRLVLCATAAWGGFAVTSAPAQDADAASRVRIENLTAEERAALRDRHEAFLALPEAERRRLRDLHARLQEEGPAGELNQTLDRLQAVLARMTPSERAAVDSAETSAEKITVLRRVIGGYRSIPPPLASLSDWNDRLPGERSPLDWPRRDLIEEELIRLLSERTSLLRLEGEDPLALPRHERLLRVLEAAATTRGSLRPRPPEDWLPDDLLAELDVRLTERGLPGLSAWLSESNDPRSFTVRFARMQLIEVLADASRDAWTKQIGGPGGERLLDHLSDLPNRDALQAAGGAAREELAERVVRANEEITSEELGLTPEQRNDAERAFELAKRMREYGAGFRRFPRRSPDWRSGDRRPGERRPNGPPNGRDRANGPGREDRPRRPAGRPGSP